MSLEVLRNIASDWVRRVFGRAHYTNKLVRAMRFGEEAIELMYSLGVSKEAAQRVLDHVYRNPTTSLHTNYFREMGQVMMTLNVLAEFVGTGTPEAAFEVELRRVLGLNESYFREREDAKVAAGLTPFPAEEEKR
jgi:hypothetical protein